MYSTGRNCSQLRPLFLTHDFLPQLGHRVVGHLVAAHKGDEAPVAVDLHDALVFVLYQHIHVPGCVHHDAGGQEHVVLLVLAQRPDAFVLAHQLVALIQHQNPLLLGVAQIDAAVVRYENPFRSAEEFEVALLILQGVDAGLEPILLVQHQQPVGELSVI